MPGVSFSELFRATTGLSLLAVATVRFTIWSRAVNGEIVVDSTYFAGAGITPAEAAAVLELLSADRAAIMVVLTEETKRFGFQLDILGIRAISAFPLAGRGVCNPIVAILVRPRVWRTLLLGCC